MSDAETRCAKCGMVELHHNHTYWESTHPFTPAPVAPTQPVADGGECKRCACGHPVWAATDVQCFNCGPAPAPPARRRDNE